MDGISKAVVSRILSEHKGVARRFSASSFILEYDNATLDGWLRSPALDNLQELNFSFFAMIWPTPLIPHSALRFSSTLLVAKFGCCEFPDNAAHVHFPNLQHLDLGSVTISEDSLHALLAGCPALDRFEFGYDFESAPWLQMPPSALHFSSTLRIAEFGHCQFPDITIQQFHFPNLQRLMLNMVIISEGSLHAMLSCCLALNSLMLLHSSGFRRFRINSLKLKHVDMYFRPSDADRLQELIVENAPCLERLDHRGPYEGNMHISIISAPKLKILGRLTVKISRLELGTTIFKGLCDVRIATVMRTVKVLALTLDNLGLDVITNFMNCFPCMEKLYIKFLPTLIDSNNMQCHYSQDHTECLDHHLKKLRIDDYSGKRPHVEFVKFFILNGRVLESLVLDILFVGEDSDSWITEQRRQLQLERRASIGAQIEFISDDFYNYVTDN